LQFFIRLTQLVDYAAMRFLQLLVPT